MQRSNPRRDNRRGTRYTWIRRGLAALAASSLALSAVPAYASPPPRSQTTIGPRAVRAMPPANPNPVVPSIRLGPALTIIKTSAECEVAGRRVQLSMTSQWESARALCRFRGGATQVSVLYPASGSPAQRYAIEFRLYHNGRLAARQIYPDWRRQAAWSYTSRWFNAADELVLRVYVWSGGSLASCPAVAAA